MKECKKILRQILLDINYMLSIALFIFELLSEKLVVTVPSVTVVLSPTSLDVGQPLTVSGIVKADTDVPAPAGSAVSINVTDSAGNKVVDTTATTDAQGNYTTSFPIPAGTAAGAVEVVVTALGATGTATFTSLSNK